MRQFDRCWKISALVFVGSSFCRVRRLNLGCIVGHDHAALGRHATHEDCQLVGLEPLTRREALALEHHGDADEGLRLNTVCEEPDTLQDGIAHREHNALPHIRREHLHDVVVGRLLADIARVAKVLARFVAQTRGQIHVLEEIIEQVHIVFELDRKRVACRGDTADGTDDLSPHDRSDDDAAKEEHILRKILRDDLTDAATHLQESYVETGHVDLPVIMRHLADLAFVVLSAYPALLRVLVQE
mmetsp:Transcript_314/g.582  ORF Transcript_314/g.582 Transcript_314/m.582 type:complete len:243 (-) Transcript_314:85-813(-)